MTNAFPVCYTYLHNGQDKNGIHIYMWKATKKGTYVIDHIYATGISSHLAMFGAIYE